MKELLKELIRADTSEGKGELSAAQIIAERFKRSGIYARVENWDETRANVIGHINSSGVRGALLFVCHLDVVGPGQAQWVYPPFAGIEADGRIHGRGAVDMKGGITAAVEAICETVDSGMTLHGDVIFAGTAGEETDSSGIIMLVNNAGWMPKLTGVVIPEPTSFAVVTAHRGLVWLKITTKGKAAHSSTPELGINAIGSMKRVLDKLENYRLKAKPHRLLGKSSMSINTISGGKAMNIVPDECSLGIDIRTLPGHSHEEIIEGLKAIIDKLKVEDPKFDADITLVRESEALETDSDCEFVRKFLDAVGVSESKAVGFTTDGPHLVQLGAPIVIFGPGRSELCHKPDEYIDVADIEKAVEHYKTVIRNFLA
jgi:succinyl-diaminopimelate desuccinylase